MSGFGLWLVRALLVWLVMMAAETAQGALRHLLFDTDVAFAIRQASVISGAAVIFAITWFTMRWMPIRTSAGALAVGLTWVALTLGFELLVAQPWASAALGSSPTMTSSMAGSCRWA